MGLDSTEQRCGSTYSPRHKRDGIRIVAAACIYNERGYEQLQEEDVVQIPIDGIAHGE